MLSAHATRAYFAVVVPALAQTLLIAQIGLGLLLLSDERRATDELHYVYGSLSLEALLAPWIYVVQHAPASTGRRVVRRVETETNAVSANGWQRDQLARVRAETEVGSRSSCPSSLSQRAVKG